MRLLMAAFPVGVIMEEEIKASVSSRLDLPTLRKLIHFRLPDSYDLLLETLNNSKLQGHLPPPVVDSILSREDCPPEKLMLDLLPVAQTYSYSPISKYRVGAVVRGSSGAIYLGTNIEVPGQVLGFAVHGEQCAVANAYMHEETGLKGLAVTAAPCGHCRQFLNELPQAENLKIYIAGKEPTTLGKLLPGAFGPGNLNVTDRLFTTQKVHLKLIAPSVDELSLAALEAARMAYAPYTHGLSGVALHSLSGAVYIGSYIESAAYNPSLPPLQAALAVLVMSGEKISNVQSAVLVELEKSLIHQRSAAQAVLDSIAPDARLRLVPARLDLQSG